MWLVASTEFTDVAVVRDGKPELWRELRRFNAPIQLAVAAAHDVLASAVAPADAAILSLAPCQSGSPEVHGWIRQTASGGTARVNPIYTLHCVDNLALSVLSIGIKNHAWSMSIGGAAGQAWSALEWAAERDEREVVVMGGDQMTAYDPSPVSAFAMLFSRERTPYVTTGRPTRFVDVTRMSRFSGKGVGPHYSEPVRPSDTNSHYSEPVRPSDTNSENGDGPHFDSSSSDPTVRPSDTKSGKGVGPHFETVSDKPDSLENAQGDYPSRDAAESAQGIYPSPHAAAGMRAMLAALRGAPIGHFAYVVPVVDGDGIDEIVVRWEVSA